MKGLVKGTLILGIIGYVSSAATRRVLYGVVIAVAVGIIVLAFMGLKSMFHKRY
jgi:hypothetical protein